MRSLDYVVMLILAAFFIWLLVLTTRGDTASVGVTRFSPSPAAGGAIAQPSPEEVMTPAASPEGLPSASVAFPSPSAALRSPSPSPRVSASPASLQTP